MRVLELRCRCCERASGEVYPSPMAVYMDFPISEAIDTVAGDDMGDVLSSGEKNSSSISRVCSIHFASHFAIKRLHPRLVFLERSPGMANTSFPCSRASAAVMSVPLFSAASGMRMPSESAATISFRTGNIYGSAFDHRGKIESRAHPDSSIF